MDLQLQAGFTESESGFVIHWIWNEIQRVSESRFYNRICPKTYFVPIKRYKKYIKFEKIFQHAYHYNILLQTEMHR